jgi:hypothetical protein
MKFVTSVENFVSAEESTHHQMLNKDQTLLNEICNFGEKICIRRNKAPTKNSIKTRLDSLE